MLVMVVTELLVMVVTDRLVIVVTELLVMMVTDRLVIVIVDVRVNIDRTEHSRPIPCALISNVCVMCVPWRRHTARREPSGDSQCRSLVIGAAAPVVTVMMTHRLLPRPSGEG